MTTAAGRLAHGKTLFSRSPAPIWQKYDNGGGQIGTKENPEWTAYEKLLKSYHATLRAIAAQQGGKAKEKTTGIGSPLTNYRNKYGSLKVVKDA